MWSIWAKSVKSKKRLGWCYQSASIWRCKTRKYYGQGQRIGSGIGRLFQTTSNEPARSANDHGKLPPDYLRETRISKPARETNPKFILTLCANSSRQKIKESFVLGINARPKKRVRAVPYQSCLSRGWLCGHSVQLQHVFVVSIDLSRL